MYGSQTKPKSHHSQDCSSQHLYSGHAAHNHWRHVNNICSSHHLSHPQMTIHKQKHKHGDIQVLSDPRQCSVSCRHRADEHAPVQCTKNLGTLGEGWLSGKGLSDALCIQQRHMETRNTTQTWPAFENPHRVDRQRKHGHSSWPKVRLKVVWGKQLALCSNQRLRDVVQRIAPWKLQSRSWSQKL